MQLQKILSKNVIDAFDKLFNVGVKNIEFQPTKKEFEGDITIVIFPFVKLLKQNPKDIAEKLGSYLEKQDYVVKYNVVSGFLNLVISDEYYLDFFESIKSNEKYGFITPTANDAVMVEYSSPNTNKPLHLGHIRNNLLGYSVSEILKASGKKVYKTQIINDRGIHICKSMVSWLAYGNGETPESSGLKGDKLVGNYYVKYDQVYQDQVKDLVKQGTSEDDAKQQAPILQESKECLTCSS